MVEEIRPVCVCVLGSESCMSGLYLLFSLCLRWEAETRTGVKKTLMERRMSKKLYVRGSQMGVCLCISGSESYISCFYLLFSLIIRFFC